MLQGQLYRKDVCILRNLVSNPYLSYRVPHPNFLLVFISFPSFKKYNFFNGMHVYSLPISLSHNKCMLYIYSIVLFPVKSVSQDKAVAVFRDILHSFYSCLVLVYCILWLYQFFSASLLLIDI